MAAARQQADSDLPVEATKGEPWGEYRQRMADGAARATRQRGGVNKTLAIRQEAQRLISEGKPPRPREIIQALANRGIRVTSPQVTMACKGTGLMLKEHRAKQHEPRDEELPAFQAAISLVSLDDLIQARDFVRRLGSVDRAIASLVAFRQLGNREEATAPNVPADGSEARP